MLKTDILISSTPSTPFTEAFPTLASYQDALHFLDNSSLFHSTQFTVWTLCYKGELVGASHFPATLIKKLVIGWGVFKAPTLIEQKLNRNLSCEFISYLLFNPQSDLPGKDAYYKNEVRHMSDIRFSDIFFSTSYDTKYGYTLITNGFWDKPVVKWVGSRDRAIAGMFKNAQAAYAEWERDKAEGSWSRRPFYGHALMESDFDGSHSWLGKYLRAKNTGLAMDMPVRKATQD